jgi:hypothetical protein
LVDILRGRAKNSRCLSWLRFPTPRAKARFSASSFCALTSRTAGRLLRLLVKPRSLIERLQYWLERFGNDLSTGRYVG